MPGGGDDVTINAAGTYTINANLPGGLYSVSTLDFDAPSAIISITQPFTVLHGATLASGSIDGPSNFATDGVTLIPSGASLTLGGGLHWFVSNGSSASLSAAINIGDLAGATATIVDNGTFDLLTDAAGIALNPSGMATFQNGGTLEKTGGTGISRIFANVTNKGTVSVTTGTLEFDGPSNTLAGTISGVGTVAFAAGTTQLQVNPTVSNLLFDGATVTFIPTLSYSGNFVETAGKLTLSGTTPTISGTFTLAGGALNFGAGATLTLHTTTDFAGGTVTGGTVAMNGNTAVTGTTLIQAALTNTGTIAADAGTLDLAGAVSGSGQMTISTGATLELGQASAATQKVTFTDTTGTLQLDQPGLFKRPIFGFQRGDTIDAIGVTANSAVYSGGNLTLRNGATTVLQLTVSTPYASPVFNVASDQHGVTLVTVFQPPLRIAPSDFNNDGDSDLLWQNSSGQGAIWELNGANVVVSGLLGNPGPSWHI